MRVLEWPQRLDEAIAAASTRSFRYGGQDCALFAADCVLAMTGVDYASELRGYESKLAAYRIVERYGSLEAMITALLQRDPKHPAQARRGDVVMADIELAPGESGESIGVCDGLRCWFPQAVGLRSLPRSRARIAWSID